SSGESTRLESENNELLFTSCSPPAYFAIQVITFRRKFKVSPPIISGPPEFERIFRAQANCSEYFPIFLSLLWVAGIFSHQVLAAFCGLIYLYARYQYFRGYAHSAERRLISGGAKDRLLLLSLHAAKRRRKKQKEAVARPGTLGKFPPPSFPPFPHYLMLFVMRCKPCVPTGHMGGTALCSAQPGLIALGGALGLTFL
uniref:Leukotriene C4 synthase n=1 Tax=Laticauda laticaudata TaxID=8630 RepID=A0A8C5SGI0_LATLA